jgi:type IX secretion system PorP/SprF family membrane protein
MNRILLSLLFLGYSLILFCQENVDTYPFNKLQFNPATAGHEDKTSVFLSGRAEFFGLTDYPHSIETGFESNIKPINSGVGAVFLYEKWGIIKTYKYSLVYNYKFIFSENQSLRIGLKPNTIHTVIDKSLMVGNVDDPVLSQDLSNTLYCIDIGMLYQFKSLECGLSLSNLMSDGSYQLNRKYYTYLSYKYQFTENFIFSPQFIWVNTPKSELNDNSDINTYNFIVGFLFWNKMQLGINYMKTSTDKSYNYYSSSIGIRLFDRFDAIYILGINNNEYFKKYPNHCLMLKYSF